MKRCTKCKGSGRVPLLTSTDPCPECEGRGHLPSKLEFELGAVAEDTWENEEWPEQEESVLSSFRNPPHLSLAPPGGDAGAFIISQGHRHPAPTPALPGSLYLRNNNGRGEFWLKTGTGDHDWHPMATPAPEPPKETRFDLPDEDRVAWAARMVNDENPPEGVVTQTVMGSYINPHALSDLLVSLEEIGAENLEFVLPSSFYANLRTWEAPYVSHEGRRIKLYGVPVTLCAAMDRYRAAVVGEVEGKRHLSVAVF